MYRTTLLTFADEKFEQKRQHTIQNTAHLYDNYINYGPGDVDQKFIHENMEICYSDRGYGYWIWKPYIILNFSWKS